MTTGVSNTKRLTVYRAMGASPSTGTIVITFANALNGCNWSVLDVSGVDTTGTNGSGAIVQAVTGSNASAGTSLSITLAAFGSASNATFGTFATDISGNITPGTGFTEIGEASTASPVLTINSQYQLANDTTVDASFASARAGGIAIEIKDGGVAGANLTFAKTESPDTLSSTASASINLSLARTESPGTLTSSASVSLNLTLAKTESPDTLSASVSTSTGLSFVAATSGALAWAFIHTVTKPAGVAEGDLMIATLARGVAGTYTPPSGWTLLQSGAFGSTRNVTTAYKVAGASEATTYDFTHSTQTDAVFSVVAYRTLDTAAPVGTPVLTESQNTVDITIPSVTTARNGSFAVFIAVDNNELTLGTPAGTTKRVEFFDGGMFLRVAVFDEARATAGATGTRVATTGATVWWAAISVEVNAVSTGRALTLAVIESPDALSSTASASINLTLARTESPDTLASSASVALNLSLAVTESPDMLAADATTAQPTRTISLAGTESPDTISSSASASINLSAAITESPDTLAATASVSTNLTLAKTESPDTLTSTASVPTNLALAKTESPDTLVAFASVALNLSLSVVESPDTLVASISVSGLAERVLTFAVTESPDTLVASASVGALPTRTIDAILIELPDTLAASASVSVGASLSATEQGDTLTASASVALNLALAVTESPDTLASSASVSAFPERVLTFAVVESPDTLIAAAIVSAFDTRLLTLAITEARDTLSADALTVSIPFTSVHASITQRGVGTLIAARVATPAIIQRVPSVGVVRAGAEGRITQPDIRIAITQEP